MSKEITRTADGITDRREFWKEAFWRPAGTLVTIPYALWGLLAFIRDEIIQPQHVERWKPIYWLSKHTVACLAHSYVDHSCRCRVGGLIQGST